MTMDSYPSLEEFLVAPIEDVIKVAPKTLIFAPGGTRRSAVFAGIAAESNEYPYWSRKKIVSCIDLLFRHGVRHIFISLLTQSQSNEETIGFSDQLLDWIDWGISGPEALADYQHLGWQVRLLGAENQPKLNRIAERLATETAYQSNHSLWWFMGLNTDQMWMQTVVNNSHQSKLSTRQKMIQALYGEDIPLATLFLSFGKPMISPDLVPPLLMGNLQCYWPQKPSYDLDEQQLRTIFYDYKYNRNTWRKNKHDRAQAALAHRLAWETGPTIGVGQKLGPFWYPLPSSGPA